MDKTFIVVNNSLIMEYKDYNCDFVFIFIPNGQIKSITYDCIKADKKTDKKTDKNN